MGIFGHEGALSCKRNISLSTAVFHASRNFFSHKRGGMSIICFYELLWNVKILPFSRQPGFHALPPFMTDQHAEKEQKPSKG
jgi:hypothetical protein